SGRRWVVSTVATGGGRRPTQLRRRGSVSVRRRPSHRPAGRDNPPHGGRGGPSGGSRSSVPRSIYRGASRVALSFEARRWWGPWEAATRVRLWAADRAPDGVRAVTYQELGNVYTARGLPARAADAYTISQ